MQYRCHVFSGMRFAGTPPPRGRVLATSLGCVCTQVLKVYVYALTALKTNDCMRKSITKEELSDQQIQDIVEEFANLTEEQRLERLLGEGAFKTTYQIPGSDYVIKKPKKSKEAVNDMAREYAVNKRLLHKADLEPPLLVTRKNLDKIEPYHIQRKVLPLENLITDQIKSNPRIKALQDEYSFYSMLHERLWELINKETVSGDIEKAQMLGKDFRNAVNKAGNIRRSLIEAKISVKEPFNKILDEVSNKLESSNIVGADIHSGNVTKEGKIFDLGSWVDRNGPDSGKSDGLLELRKNVVNRTLKTPSSASKYTVYRSLIPVLGKAATTVAGGLATLAAEAADSTEEGSSLEEAAMHREAQDRKFRKAVGEDAYQKSQQLMQNMSTVDLLDKSAHKPQFKALREKLK